MSKVKPGDPLRFPAGMFNDLVDMWREWRANRRRQTPGGKAGSPPLRIRNDSGEDLDRGEILGVDGVVFAEADNSAEFRNRPTLKGAMPDIESHAGNFAVLLEPCKNGKFARCSMSGIVTVQVDITDASHDWCDVEDNEHETLTSYGAASARIVHKPSGTGVKWCLVNLAQSHGPAREYRGLINDGGGFLTSDTTTAMDALEAVDGVAIYTELETVYNVFSWSGSDDAEALARYNAETGEWELRMVACA